MEVWPEFRLESEQSQCCSWNLCTTRSKLFLWIVVYYENFSFGWHVYASWMLYKRWGNKEDRYYKWDFSAASSQTTNSYQKKSRHHTIQRITQSDGRAWGWTYVFVKISKSVCATNACVYLSFVVCYLFGICRVWVLGLEIFSRVFTQLLCVHLVFRLNFSHFPTWSVRIMNINWI